MLQDMLDYIISILILHELLRVLVKLLQDREGLVGETVFQDPLDHPTAIWVRRQSKHLPLECIDDELQRLGLYTFNALLNHMVAILVFHTLQDMAI